jgi:hypothetical protein
MHNVRSIIHSATSNAFDFFLASLLIYYSYKLTKIAAQGLKEKNLLNTFAKIVGLFIRFFLLAAVIMTLIFFLRIIGSHPHKDDYVYCLTGFFLMITPSILAIFKVTYWDVK